MQHRDREVVSKIHLSFIMVLWWAVCVAQDLYQRCEKMRPTLFRLASDTEDNDEALGECYVIKYH